MFSLCCNLFLAVLMLGAVQTLSKPNIDKDFDDYVGRPGRPSTSYSEKDKCKKDILLIVDTSLSIGKSNFEKHVKPFLQKFVNDRRLNVNRDGTQVAMMVFSDSDKTEMLLNFGDIYNKYELENYIQNLRWDKIKGDRTRTDVALEKANVVFPRQSPGNNRADAADVVLLMTDGEPRGKWNTKKMARKYADLLNNKNVLIVVAPFGHNRHKFITTLQQLATSEKYTLGANINEIDQFLEDFVENVCAIKESGYIAETDLCACPETASAPIYVKPGHTTAEIYWLVPEYSCGSRNVQRLTVKPDVTSPHAFPVGKHTITYTYHLKSGMNVDCLFHFEVFEGVGGIDLHHGNWTPSLKILAIHV